MAGRCGRHEKALVVRVFGDETLDEFWTDLITCLADRGAEAGDDAAAVRTQRLHGGDGIFEHARQRALPAGMSGADDAIARVSKQDRSAIGGKHAKHNTRGCRYHRIGVGADAVIIGADRHDIRGMDLMHGCQPLDRQAEPGGDATAIFQDLVAFVAGAQTDIKAAIQPFGNAAYPE